MQALVEHVESVGPLIKYTIGKEADQLAFLDVQIIPNMFQSIHISPDNIQTPVLTINMTTINGLSLAYSIKPNMASQAYTNR